MKKKVKKKAARKALAKAPKRYLRDEVKGCFVVAHKTHGLLCKESGFSLLNGASAVNVHRFPTRAAATTWVEKALDADAQLARATPAEPTATDTVVTENPYTVEPFSKYAVMHYVATPKTIGSHVRWKTDNPVSFKAAVREVDQYFKDDIKTTRVELDRAHRASLKANKLLTELGQQYAGFNSMVKQYEIS